MAHKETKLATISDRILLHLIEFKSYSDEIDGPLELTQIGIANAVGVERKNISRAIRPHIVDGYIEFHSAHIPGIRLKRVIYYLTSLGYKKALNTKKALEDFIIEFIDLDGKKTNKTMMEIMQLVPLDINFVDVIRECHTPN